jgi:phosphoglycolate phosphatase-like HAD superfamily hydrolase
MELEPLADRADALHRVWLPPWELTDLAPHAPAPEWAVLADDGTLHRDTARWAWAVLAHAPGRPRAEAFAADAAAAEAAFRAGAVREGEALLWRHDRVAGAGAPAAAPRAILPRPQPPVAPALLCDFGRVLVDFDYGLFARHFTLGLGHPPPAEGQRILDELLPLAESGALPPEELFERAYRELRLARPDRALFRELWNSILFPLPAGATWMRRLLAEHPRTALVVASNIDPWRLRHARERMALDDLLRVTVASFEDGVRPKHEDASMWERALAFARMRLGTEPDAVIVLDDIPRNLATARAAGIGTRHVQVLHPAQMRAELGAAGLYLPLAVQAGGR